jgi:chromosomal replication initiation ATPase DnaA
MKHGRQLALPLPHAPSLGFLDFLEGPGNADALAWLRAAAWPADRLLLWGPAGAGKTHLLSAWAAQRGAHIVSAAALGPWPQPGAVAVDDVDLAHDGTRGAALLHLLNVNAEAGLPTLLAARTPPARLDLSPPDLASRLRATAAVRMDAPGDALLGALFDKLLADRQLLVAPALRRWMLPRLPRTAAALREAVARLDRASLAAGRAVGRAQAAQVVAELGHDSSTMARARPSRTDAPSC